MTRPERSSNRDLALEFLARFCAGDIEGLAPLLAEDLRFLGPLLEADSRSEYIDSLRSDPPEKCAYVVLSLTEGVDSVSIFYDYEKVGRSVRIAQLFRFSNGRISELMLVFDTRLAG